MALKRKAQPPTKLAKPTGPSATPYLEAIGVLEEMFPERGPVARGLITALLAGAHVFVLGPPGTAKSMMVETLSRLFSDDATSWSYLMTKFTEPNEIFGPHDYNQLLKGVYKRNTEGYMPTADLVFFDEIFKANSAILNSLLMALDGRKRLKFGAEEFEVPMMLCVGASNELPQGEELAALYDRFLLRFYVDYLHDEATFKTLITTIASGDHLKPATPLLSREEVEEAQAFVAKLPISKSAVQSLSTLRETLKNKGFSISDRRWIQCIAILRAEAFLSGEAEVRSKHLQALLPVLWQTVDQQGSIKAELKVVCDPVGGKVDEITQKVSDIHSRLTKLAAISSADGISASTTLNEHINQLRQLTVYDLRDKARLYRAMKYVDVCRQEIIKKSMAMNIPVPVAAWKLLNQISEVDKLTEEELEAEIKRFEEEEEEDVEDE